jgi:hypothetical protein
MRAQAVRRRETGAAKWNGRGFRESDAGRSAWGGFKGDGKWEPHEGFQAHDYRPAKREERYMPNNRFIAFIAASVSKP